MRINNKNVFFFYDESASQSLFANIVKSEKAELISLKRNRFLDILRKLFGNKIVGYVAFKQIKRMSIRNSVVWFDNESVSSMSKSQIESIKKNNKIYLFLIDELKNNYSSINNAKKLIDLKMFDKIFTYSSFDASQYGFTHTLSYYSRLVNNSNCPCTYDAFFIGNIKNRSNIISEFLTKSDTYGLNALFYLAGDTNSINSKSYVPIKHMSYVDSLKELQKCNCIIDFVDDKNKGQSLRYFEAVIYNKKLITNNANIKSLPFYNDKYIKIIQRIDDIDFEWIKKRESVDYGYDGRFEPIHLL